MANIEVIKTDKAPAPIGPYNQAIKAGDTLYISGQIPYHPVTGIWVNENIKAETTRVMENLEAILEAAGMTFGHVVKCSIFLADMGQFPEVNEVYGSYFTDNFPARETVQVAKLPLGVNVEISAVAVD